MVLIDLWIGSVVFLVSLPIKFVGISYKWKVYKGIVPQSAKIQVLYTIFIYFGAHRLTKKSEKFIKFVSFLHLEQKIGL